jgi:hypothetical protein
MLKVVVSQNLRDWKQMAHYKNQQEANYKNMTHGDSAIGSSTSWQSIIVLHSNVLLHYTSF